MKYTLRILGIPVITFESDLTESEIGLIDNTSLDTEFGFQQLEEDDEDWEYEEYDPLEERMGFGFGVRP